MAENKKKESELTYEEICDIIDMIITIKSTAVMLFNALPEGEGKNCVGDAMCDYDEAIGRYKDIKERMEK